MGLPRLRINRRRPSHISLLILVLMSLLALFSLPLPPLSVSEAQGPPLADIPSGTDHWETSGLARFSLELTPIPAGFLARVVAPSTAPSYYVVTPLCPPLVWAPPIPLSSGWILLSFSIRFFPRSPIRWLLSWLTFPGEHRSHLGSMRSRVDGMGCGRPALGCGRTSRADDHYTDRFRGGSHRE